MVDLEIRLDGKEFALLAESFVTYTLGCKQGKSLPLSKEDRDYLAARLEIHDYRYRNW